MSYIYYVYRSNNKPQGRIIGGYIGQSTQPGITRLEQHLKGPYLKAPKPELQSGASRLFAEYGASGTLVKIFLEDENYGLGKSFDAIKKMIQDETNVYGTWKIAEGVTFLDVAEFFHIVYHQWAKVNPTFNTGDLSNLNKQIGGAGKTILEFHVNDIFAKKIESFKQSAQLGRKIEELTQIDVEKWNSPDLFRKALMPVEYRLIEEISRKYIKSVWSQEQFRNELLSFVIQNGGQLDKTKLQIFLVDKLNAGLVQRLRKDLKTLEIEWEGLVDLQQEGIDLIAAIRDNIIKKFTGKKRAKQLGTLTVGTKDWEEELKRLLFNQFDTKTNQLTNVRYTLYVPAVRLKSSTQFPVWFTTIMNNLKESIKNNAVTNTWRNKAQELSQDLFGYVYGRVTKHFPPRAKITLKERMRREFARRFSPNSEIMQHWSRYYSDMMRRIGHSDIMEAQRHEDNWVVYPKDEHIPSPYQYKGTEAEMIITSISKAKERTQLIFY